MNRIVAAGLGCRRHCSAEEIATLVRRALVQAGLAPGDLTGLFAKGVLAHGPPGDVWVMSVYGGAWYRLTSFEEDEPTLAWSPDGYWLAMLGGGGLYLLPRDLSQPARKVGRGGFGGIDWR